MSAYSDDALDRPIARTDGLATEKVDHELVIYDDASKQAHCLSPAVAAIWALCDGDTSQAGMSEKLGVSPESITEAVEELRSLGLLVEQTGINRREAAKRFATVGAAAIAGPALISSMAVPAAAAACSQVACTTPGAGNAQNKYDDWNDIPQGDSAWFRAVLTGFTGWTPDATSVLLVTGEVQLPNLNNPIPSFPTIPSRVTFTAGGNTTTITYRSGDANFGGACYADIVVPLSCANNFFINGLMLYAHNDMGPEPTKSWFYSLSVTFDGHKPSANQGISWNFGAAGYSNQSDQNLGDAGVTPASQAAYYNTFDIDMGTCGNGGAGVATPEALIPDAAGGGSGGGGANYTGSNSGAQSCLGVCV